MVTRLNQLIEGFTKQNYGKEKKNEISSTSETIQSTKRTDPLNEVKRSNDFATDPKSELPKKKPAVSKGNSTSSPLLRSHSDNPNCTNGQRYEIGFDEDQGSFLRTIELCHDKSRAVTLWAHARLTPANNSDVYKQPKDKYQSFFRTGSLYGDMRMSTGGGAYYVNNTCRTLDSILGAEGASAKYISVNLSEQKYLAKGHLIAKADMTSKLHQDSTMFYANVVPMWQQVNANPGNWFFVEEYVRHLAYHKNHELDVWAGGVGVLRLEGKEIHLYKQGTGKDLQLRIPVPKVIYKCVVDRQAKEALCFLVVNNPYAGKTEVEMAKGEYRVCQKLETCDRISPNHDDPAKGYMYCCDLRSFYKKNHKELGLDELKDFVGYKKLELSPWKKTGEYKPSKKNKEKNF
ncbi:uncharacterized protein LOC106644495 [Copidosoma floridanum]|uniref:uncharacterized protein LOC106644495 n=1 Tax=Copidosoma floridanum TaxID=29053 RepID=UPI0006C9DE63|nr:uncharacterized protein LOC106644495 [Copidosoma floridanum]